MHHSRTHSQSSLEKNMQGEDDWDIISLNSAFSKKLPLLCNDLINVFKSLSPLSECIWKSDKNTFSHALGLASIVYT